MADRPMYKAKAIYPTPPSPSPPPTPKFDPEGEGYDYESAEQAGLTPDDTGHWPSREPSTGLLLKGRKHPTWYKTVEGEDKAGYEIYYDKGRYYSRLKQKGK